MRGPAQTIFPVVIWPTSCQAPLGGDLVHGRPVLSGRAGNDRLIGGAGLDTIDGGVGNDTAVYSGHWSDYSIEVTGDVVDIVDLRSGSPDGADRVIEVENFEFADRALGAIDPVANKAPTAPRAGRENDFDGDGKADILWQHDSGQAGIWFMDGQNLTGSAEVGPNPGAAWHVKGADDFNGDGKAAILWQHENGQATIWLIDGQNLIGAGAVGPNPGIWFMDGQNLTGSAAVGPNPGAAWHVTGDADWLV